MDTIQQYNKAIVAAIMAILMVLELVFGWSPGITEEHLLIILAILTPIFVWLVPNRTKE